MDSGHNSRKEPLESRISRLEQLMEEVRSTLSRFKPRNSYLEAVSGNPLLDNSDLQRILNCTARTLHRLRSTGILPYFRVGRRIFYNLGDIMTMVDARFGKDAALMQRVDERLQEAGDEALTSRMRRLPGIAKYLSSEGICYRMGADGKTDGDYCEESQEDLVLSDNYL